MSGATYVNDAGTWRRLKGIYVNDAGTWRPIKKAYVNDAGTWRTVFTRGDDFQIQAGSLANIRGYNLVAAIGTILTPVSGVLSTGKSINAIQDNTSVSRFEFGIEGFSSNPGQSYLNFVDVNGTT